MATENEDSFTAMFTELYPAARRAAVLWVGLSMADDVVSLAMARAWRQFDGRPEDRVESWLLTMVYNEARNARRAEARRAEAVNQLEFTRYRTSTSLNESQVSVEELEHLTSVLATMSVADREVLALSWWEELSDDDIAAIFGITKNAAAVRLSRARQRFYRAMAQTDERGSVA